MKRTRKPQTIGVLEKAFRLIEIIQDAREPMNLKRLSVTSGLTNSTAYRLLGYLTEKAWLVRDARGNYTSSPKLPGSHEEVDPVSRLSLIARPFFWGLLKYTGETVSLAMLDGSEVVFLDGMDSPHQFRVVARGGQRSVFYRIALGKAIVAHLPMEEREEVIARSMPFHKFTHKTVESAEELRVELARIVERGFAIDDEESFLGLRCLAAPILSPSGHPIVGISISGPTSRVTRERVDDFGAAVREAADQIAAAYYSGGRLATAILEPGASRMSNNPRAPASVGWRKTLYR